MDRQRFEEFYQGTILPIVGGICKENDNYTFADNFGGLYEEYLNQRALLKLLVKNAGDDPKETLLDRHKVAACITVAVMKTRLLYPSDLDDANNEYSLFGASRMNEQLAFLTGINVLLSYMIEETPSIRETLTDFKLPQTRYPERSTYFDSMIRALYYSNTTSGFQTLLLSNIFFLLEEYHKLSCSLNEKNKSMGDKEKQ
jgi:hypothetical protein